MSDPISRKGMASTIIATKLMDRLPTTACNPNKSPIKSNPTDSNRKAASIITGIIEGLGRRSKISDSQV